MVAGCGLHAAAFATHFLSRHYWQLANAAVLDGLGSTFGNGAIDAWAIGALDGAPPPEKSRITAW